MALSLATSTVTATRTWQRLPTPSSRSGSTTEFGKGHWTVPVGWVLPTLPISSLDGLGGQSSPYEFPVRLPFDPQRAACHRWLESRILRAPVRHTPHEFQFRQSAAVPSTER